MIPQNEPTLNIQDVPFLIKTYWRSMVVSGLCGAVLFAAATVVLPKKYKAHFVLTIYSKYFQSPLIGDFVPGISESGENRSQRESLIKQALTPEYLDSLGEKYNIYHATATAAADLPSPSAFRLFLIRMGLARYPDMHSRLTQDREDLRERIRIDSLNSTTFHVGFVYSSPEVAYHVTRDIYDQMIRSLLDVRMRTLANVRDAIQQRLESLSVTLSRPVRAAPPVQGSNLVREELESVRAQIRSLASEYTDEHPVMIQLREQEAGLKNRLESHQGRNMGGGSTGSAGNNKASQDVYDDLTKKLNYLNIAIETDREYQADYFAALEPPLYPSSAKGPPRPLLILWGMAIGVFGALFVAALREFFRRSTLHASSLASHLHLPLLGELPRLPK